MPTKTPTPANRLSVSATGFTIDASGGQKTVTVTGQSGTLRADRNSDAMWLTASVNGSSVTFKVTQNQSTSVRTGTVDITDMGSGKTIRITVTQRGAATANPTKIPTNTPAPTRVPTKAPTRKPTAIPTKTPTPTPRTGTVANYPELKVTIVSGATEYDWGKFVNKNGYSFEQFYVQGIVGELHYAIETETAPRGWLKVDIYSTNGADSADVRVYADDVDTYVEGHVVFWDDLGRNFTVDISVDGRDGNAKGLPTPTPMLKVTPTVIEFAARGETKTVYVKDRKGDIQVESHPDWVKPYVYGSNVFLTAEENFGAKRDGYVVITDSKTGLSCKIHVVQEANVFYKALQKAIDIAKPRYTPTPTPTRDPANPFRITKVTGADWDGSSVVVYKDLKDGGTADIQILYEGAVVCMESKIFITGVSDSVANSAEYRRWINVAPGDKYTNIRITKNPTDSFVEITILLTDLAGNNIFVYIYQDRSPEYYAVDDAIHDAVNSIIGPGDTQEDFNIADFIDSVTEYIERRRREILEQQNPDLSK